MILLEIRANEALEYPAPSIVESSHLGILAIPLGGIIFPFPLCSIHSVSLDVGYN